MGLRLDSYRSQQLQRRLAFFRQRHGIGTLTELASRLRTDTALRQAFADYVTINVSEFYRNPQRFADLAEKYLPAMLGQRPRLKVWSAGCSIGAEIYTIALLLHRLTPGRSHDLLATDIDEGSMAKCRSGIYQPHELREVPAPVMRQFFFETPTGFELSATVRNQVKCSRHDMLKDPFPSDQDLITCRNVVIYFTEEAKAQLYRKFHASLRPGGILFIGATESIFEARAIGLQYLAPCFYQKPSVS